MYNTPVEGPEQPLEQVEHGADQLGKDFEVQPLPAALQAVGEDFLHAAPQRELSSRLTRDEDGQRQRVATFDGARYSQRASRTSPAAMPGLRR